MKLSRIIELALIHYYGAHWSKCNFMCIAVEHLLRVGMITLEQQQETEAAIMGLMQSIQPEQQHYCLIDALYRSKRIATQQVVENMAYTTQLYVWWVFDLKNKGL